MDNHLEDVSCKSFSSYENLMQFTGLLDRHEKEIYSGDILKDGNKIFQVFDYKGGFTINTFQDELKDGFTATEALADNQTCSYVESNCEVIGNIYENLDLLLSSKGDII